MTQEPPSLNSMQATDLVSGFVLGHIKEGLLRYDRRGRLAPGVAESWEVSAKQLVFHLRADARWHDGSVVTAADFVYAWRRVVDPAAASPFAAIMYPIKNAQAVAAGDLPPSALGVTAINDQLLQVDLEIPCGYCLSLMTGMSFLPVKAGFHEAVGDQYGAQVTTLLSNGPFVLTEWVHDSRLLLQKNVQYWNREAITLQQIKVAYITSDNRTRLNLFRDGQIAFARLGSETVAEAADLGLRIRTFSSGGLAFLSFNHREGRATADPALRRAIQAAFDPDEYVNQVVAIPGYKPTGTIFPGWLRGAEQSFIVEFPPPLVERGQKIARQELAEVSYSRASAEPLTLLTVSSTTGIRAAEYLQGRLSQELGLEIRVDQQSFKQYLARARAGDFDLALSSWFPDFDDLITYADLLGTHNPNNRGRYQNPDYDRWLEVLRRNTDPAVRLPAADAIQRIVVSDVPILPMAETSSAYLQHPRLKGVVRRTLGQDPDFTYARVLP